MDWGDSVQPQQDLRQISPEKQGPVVPEKEDMAVGPSLPAVSRGRHEGGRSRAGGRQGRLLAEDGLGGAVTEGWELPGAVGAERREHESRPTRAPEGAHLQGKLCPCSSQEPRR